MGGPGRGPVLNFGKTGGAAAPPAPPVCTGLNDIPLQGHPGWNVKNLKEFCEKKKLKVSAIHSKSSQKKPILKDYKDAIDKYKENSDCKFRADEIMNKHGIIPIRLPPYHPELNAIERI